MKILITTILLVFLNVCERPPVGKEINRSSAAPSSVDHSSMKHPMASSPNAASAPFELQFIDTMIAHHQGAIDMAELADTRAQREEVKTLAKAVIADQQREIARLRSWRAEWFGEAELAINMDFPGMRKGMAAMDIGKLDRLKATPFDIEFVKQMIPHHESAIAMAKAVSEQDVHVELKDLASGIIKTQSAEVDVMNRWLAEWTK